MADLRGFAPGKASKREDVMPHVGVFHQQMAGAFFIRRVRDRSARRALIDRLLA